MKRGGLRLIPMLRLDLASRDNQHCHTRDQKDSAAQGVQALPAVTFGAVNDECFILGNSACG